MDKIRISLKKIIGGERFSIYNCQKFIKCTVNLVLFLLIVVCVASNTQVMAQGCDNVTACVTGEVRDKDKKPIPNAVVRFKHKSKGITIITQTDSKGVYTRNGLEPGDYTITVSAPDFLESESRDQTLYATKKPTIIPAFELVSAASVATGSVQPTPTPPASPAVSPTPFDPPKEAIALEPQRSVNFGSSEVTALPLGGSTFVRSFDELAFLVPGVAPPPQAIGNSVGPGVGPGVGTSGQFSVNGLRSRANNFMVDGSDNNDEDIGVRRQGFFSLIPQPIESVQEFTIITALAPAIFGRNLGAQVNVISKTGGNDFHGTLYAFFNSSSLNARNYFDYVGERRCDVNFVNGRCPLLARRRSTPTSPMNDFTSINVTTLDSNGNRNQIFAENDAGDKDSLTFLQGGGTLGGPIVPDKMFFFVSAEGQFLNAVKETHFAVPTVEQRGFLGTGAEGFYFNDIQNDIRGRAAPATFIGSYVLGLFPFPNDTASEIYGRNTYTRVLSADARGRVISGKYDYSFGEEDRKQTFTARYNYTDDWRDLQQVGGAVFSSIRPLTRTDNFSAYLSGALTGKLSNVLRLSWGRTRLKFEENNYTEAYLRRISGDLNSDESRFLLNGLGLVNRTIANFNTNDEIELPPQVTFGVDPTAPTIERLLGPVGQVNIYGFSPLGVDVFNFPQQRVNNTFQFADTMFLTSGDHNIAFGTDIRRTYLESDLPRNSRLLITSTGGFRASNYPANARFPIPALISPIDLIASGNPTGVFQSIVLPGNDANINLSYNQLNFFAQDDYRIKTNLSISYGLRYELNTVPEEADGKIENDLQSSLPVALSGLNRFIDGREKIYDLDSNNLAPRIGFAYAPNPATVIRGGYGIYYDQILGAVVSQSRNVFPTFSTVNFGGVSQGTGSITDFGIYTPYNFTINGQQLIQQGRLNILNSPALTQQQLIDYFAQNSNRFPTPFGATIPDRNLDTPLSHQYSVGFEQEIFDTIFSIAYVGTTGRNLLRFTTPNAGRNNIVSISNFGLNQNVNLIISGNNRAPIREQSNIGSIDRFETTGRSQYHSLQFQLRGRLARSLQYQVGYTLANAKDDVSDVFDLAGAPALPQNSGTFAGEYAPANFDVRHRFTYNFYYDLPKLNNRNDLAEYLLGGWQLAGTGRYNTGQPFTVNTTYDVNQDGNPTDRLNSLNGIEVTGDRRQPLRLTANPLTLLAAVGQDGSVRRNSFRAGDLLELDLSFSKRFFVREEQNLQLRFDVFNFINRANFGVPVRFLEFPGFGQAVETITPGRRIQIALKYNF